MLPPLGRMAVSWCRLSCFVAFAAWCAMAPAHATNDIVAPTRNEMAAMKPRQLKTKALELGVNQALVDAADDADDVKGHLVNIIAEHAAGSAGQEQDAMEQVREMVEKIAEAGVCDPSDAGGPTVKLQTGHNMPLVGLGTWQIPPDHVSSVVRTALRAGYRHIDCAAVYGHEKQIGSALAETVGDGGGKIPRSDVFVTSKLWNSEHKPEYVRPALEQTLADLGLEYLDLYLIHWPQAFEKVAGTTAGRPAHSNGSMIYDFETSLADTWAAMEALQRDGLVRSIGLSNFNSLQITALEQTATIQPAVLQVESHPFFAQQKLLDFCTQNGRNIVMTAYSPLASGGKNGMGYSVVAKPPHQPHPLLMSTCQSYTG